MSLISLVLLIVGLFTNNGALLITAWLFAIADSIDTFRYRYFKNKD